MMNTTSTAKARTLNDQNLSDNIKTPSGSTRTLGVLGGMGPLATADFFTKLIELTPAKKDSEHIPVLVRSVPQIPARAEAILGGGARPAAALVAGAQQLVLSGAQVIAMPCNTAHAWWAEIARGVPGVPVLHIVDAVLKALRTHAPNALRIGLLATDGTHRAGIYVQRALQAQARFHWIAPSDQAQLLVVEGIEAVKAHQLEQAQTLLSQAVEQLIESGAQAIVAACTEVPIGLHGALREKSFSVPIIDSTLALAEMAVQACWHIPADKRGKHGVSSASRTTTETMAYGTEVA